MSEAFITRVKNLSRAVSVAIAVVVFLGDQATKAMVEEAIPERAVVPVIPHFFSLTHVKNAGAAFGLFADSPAPWKTALLVVISTSLLAVVVSFIWRSRQLHWETGVGLALILGGAFSNLVDRIRLGRVLDFLDLYYQGYHWPAFNLADSAIVAGVGFLVLQVLFSD